ncbi:hypothetical protein ALC57_04184 [Trachymyrmex cornetzi]|uniref:Uncharacterized protein n=1 Tax=Trachymyrmex cornetzi TaxID=471704 RepID=A0A195EDX6_9HYME|nr:hypothetical protein ALC57_04184 [Trachymyrmex cornetzi]
MEERQRDAYACQNTLVHIEEATTIASAVVVIAATALLFLVACPGVPRVPDNPDWSEARYSFVLRRGCFLLCRWCVTRRRKKKWKTARYRPFPSPLSIATPSRLRLRHVICATVGSWNFVSPKITPAHGPSKEGREATQRAAYIHSPLALSFCKRADRRRQSVNRAHTWPIAVRYMHLYEVYPKTRASLVAKKRDGCCGHFGVLSRHPSLSGQRARKINNRTVGSCRVGDRRIVSLVADRNRGRLRIGTIMIKSELVRI